MSPEDQPIWWNYKMAADLPPEAVERMWRALDRIAGHAGIQHPGHVDFLTKADIVSIAKAALPSDADVPHPTLSNHGRDR